MTVLRNKEILLVSPEPWNHIFVSKHHYAVHLARRCNRVFFLNPPGRHEGVSRTTFENVFEVDYKGFPRGLRYFPKVFRRFIMRKTFKRLSRKCGAEFDIVWSFDNSVFFDFHAFPANVLGICHIVDYNQDFQTDRAASSADYCFCCADSIRSRLLRFSDRVFKINHGYNGIRSAANKAETPGTNRLRAVYAGNIAIPYIDWFLFESVAERHPEVDFEFIGPDVVHSGQHGDIERAKSRVLKKANVIRTAPVSADAIQSHYDGADVLMVAYREEYQANQVTNSHKIMEYLGSGKVIVATYTAEYADLDPLILMSSNNSEWAEVFKKAIENLGFYNSKELRSRRTTIALDNTYDEQIMRIERIIEGKFNG